ncbi:MAG: YtxH domain-containing protein [Terriglobia bacterium]
MTANGSEGGSRFAYFLAGFGFGAVLALFFAPGKGEQTRDVISAKANESREYVTSRSREMRGQAEQMVNKAKDLVTQQKEQLSAALEAGKQAYQEERSKPH